MFRSVSFLLSLIFLTNSLLAQDSVPIKQVRLYKNGMAYIVRAGEIESPLSLSFSVTDMNDILKSFAAWNPESRTLYPTGYTSDIPVNKMLSRYPFTLQGYETGLADFLREVRGTGVKVSLGSKGYEGILMTVEAVNRVFEKQALKDYQVTLLLDEGGLFKAWLSEISRIDLADRTLNEQLESYLKTMSQGIKGTTAEITVYPISDKGSLNVAYLQQFPVWKSSYRLDMGDEIMIQGWAQVDNPSGEAWDEVDLTLISGSPASFVTNLYQPLYSVRSSVRMPGSYVPLAPVHEAEVRKSISRTPKERNAIYGVVTDTSGGKIPGVTVTARASSGRSTQAYTDDSGYYEITGLAPSQYEVEASLIGFRDSVEQVQLRTGEKVRRDIVLSVGQITETVSLGTRTEAARKRYAASAPAPPRPSGNLASGEKLQDYYEYSFPHPVTLEPGQSARVPFLNRVIKGEKVTILSPSNPHPYFAVDLENDTGMPIDAGPVTVFQEGSYSGETMMEYLSGGEGRLLSYGIDHELESSSDFDEEEEELASLSVNSGVMFFHWESKREVNYLLKNNSDSGKTLILEHAKIANQTIKSPKVDSETDNYYRFRIKMGPGEERRFPIVESISSRKSVMVRELDENDLLFYFEGTSIPPSLINQFKKLIELSENLADLKSEKRKLEQARQKIFDDQKRIRENLKALRNSNEEKSLRKRYLDELESQENQLKSLEQKINELTETIRAAEQVRNDAARAIQWEGEVG